MSPGLDTIFSPDLCGERRDVSFGPEAPHGAAQRVPAGPLAARRDHREDDERRDDQRHGGDAEDGADVHGLAVAGQLPRRGS